MRKLLPLAILVLLPALAYSQVFWTENFNNGCTSGCDASVYVSVPNGPWTQTITGAEGADPNIWYVSCAENGHTPTICGTGCVAASATATLASLHLGSNPNSLGDAGAAYDAGGLCGILTCPQTNRRIESPTINCTGQNTITLAFNYIENGMPPNDDASVWYFDGVTWTLLVNTPQTVVCGSGQGQWTAFSIALPASANNNPNVKIGFLWVNNDDGAGTDPSFAVDDVTLSVTSASAPISAFTASATSVCVGQAVNFTDMSTGGPTSWAWTFPSGAPPNASTQNVTGVTWSAAGTYSVTLTASNVNGTSTSTVVVTVNPSPTVTITSSQQTICVGNSTSLTGVGAGTFSWQPGNLSGSPIIVTPPVTTTYTLTGTNAFGCQDTAQYTIYVNNCTVPNALFTASDTTICVGDCINYTDQSTNSPSSWSWTFSGAATATSSVQNPTNICYNSPGTFAVTLIVTNASGNGSLTKTGYIIVNPPPAAFAGADVSICTGQQTVLNATGGVGYLWQPGNQPTATYSVTPLATTTYTVLVTDAIGCTGSDQVVVTVAPCTVPVAAASASQSSVCAGDCIDFTDNTTGTPTGWAWSFPGSATPTSTSQNPTTICYNTPGTYTVTLIVTNAFGADTTTIIITAGSPPTADAGPTVSIAIGNQTILTATGGTGTYSWSPTNGLASPNSATTTASPTVTTTYTVTFVDANGCTDSDTVTVQVIEAYGIFVPSAFSPNNDGSNDILFVYGAGIKTLEFAVYDRYGEKVFESTSVNDGWDGTFRDKPMNGGIFTWYCNATYYDGNTESLKGDVTLIR